MEKWKTLPQFVPVDGEQVWCRLNYWFGPPFLAVYSEVQQAFISSNNSIIFPTYVISRWRSL